MKSIGIKLADGSFYPVLEEGSAEKKKLELTTVQDNQTTVQIDLYRSESGSIEDAEYVDTLEIRNMKPHPNGEPNLQLDISLDENDQLKAEVMDPETGKVSETQVRLVSRTLAERNEPVNFNIDDITNVTDDSTDNSNDDTDVFANTIANDLPPIDTKENDMIGTSPNDEDFSFDDLNSDLDSILNDDSKNEVSNEIEEDITEEPSTSDDGFDFGDVAVGVAAGAAVGAAAGFALNNDNEGVENEENPIESIIEDSEFDNADNNDLSPSDSLADFNLDDFAPVESSGETSEINIDGSSDENNNISEIEENLGLSNNGLDENEGLSDDDVIDVPTGSEGISDSEIESDLDHPDVPENDILSTESVLSSLDNDDSILDEATANQIEEDAVFQSLENDSNTDSILDSLNENQESSELTDLGNFIEDSDDSENSSNEIDLNNVLDGSESVEEPEVNPEESVEADDNMELPDFDISGNDDNVSVEDSASEESEEIDLPDFGETENSIVEDSESDSNEDLELPDFGESGSSIVEDSESDSSENIELPDFGETVESESEVNIPQENGDMDLPDSGSESSDDSLNTDFELPNFDTETETSQTETPESNEADFELPDFGSVDLSDTETSTDDFIAKDKTFVPENSMFNDLYDEETKEGITAETKIGEEQNRSKTKIHVIICLICTVICITAALLVLFVIPSRANISKMLDKSEKEVVSESVKENEQTKVESKEESKSQAKAEEKPSTTIVITKEPLPDPLPDPEPVKEEPIADTSAKEDQIVIAEVPEVVVPQTPSAPKEKPKDVHYKIVWGDTLWDIADSYYKNPWKYKRIAKYNGIKNPNKIISGTWIWIPAE